MPTVLLRTGVCGSIIIDSQLWIWEHFQFLIPLWWLVDVVYTLVSGVGCGVVWCGVWCVVCVCVCVCVCVLSLIHI